MTELRSGVLVALLVVAGVAACEVKPKVGAEKLVRQGDAPPVVYVDEVAEEEGDTTTESEPNDEPSQAGTLALPGGVDGVLASSEDVDHYRVDVPKDAAVMVSAVGKDVDLKVEGLIGDKVVYSSDRGPKGVKEGFPNLRIDGGGTLVLRVTEFVSKKKRSGITEDAPKKAYVLRARVYAGREGEEQEPNEEPGAGEELLLGQPGYGFLGWHGDSDRWRISLDGFGEGHALNLDIRGVPGAILSASVFSPTGEVVETRKGERGTDLFFRNLEPGDEYDFFDLIISGSRSNPEEAYRVSSGSEPLEPSDEREPNDKAEQATELIAEDSDRGSARGYLLGGDIDVFRLAAPADAAVLFVSLKPPASDDLAVEVRQGGTVLAEANSSTAGGRERIAGLPVDPGAPIYVVVTGKPGVTPAHYLLEWTLTVSGSSGQ